MPIKMIIVKMKKTVVILLLERAKKCPTSGDAVHKNKGIHIEVSCG